MIGLQFAPLDVHRAAEVSSLLLGATEEYSRFFTPFSYDVEAVSCELLRARLDCFVAIDRLLENGSMGELVGFYMLRGLDEGFADPMLGLFIAEPWQGQGIARLALVHAEACSRARGYRQLLLKVHSSHHRAQRLYLGAGFQPCAHGATDSHSLVMVKSL